jgi:hypothetical protein
MYNAMGNNRSFGNSLMGRIPSLNKPIIATITNIAKELIQYRPAKYKPIKNRK